jgi:tetratricopeptide (TPR) repeat protein
MTSKDWFRNETWDEAVEAEFFAKLRRTRDKAQYLVIQAIHLVAPHPAVALRLLDKYFELDDQFNQARALETQARAYLELEDVANAIESYERALEAEERLPSMITQSYVDLPYVVASHDTELLYDRCLILLARFHDRLTFPVEHFKWHASRALILNAQGNRDESKREARNALAWAGRTESGFRYHQDLGLVNKQFAEMEARLDQLCNA